MTICAIMNCKSNSACKNKEVGDDIVHFHTFPKNKTLENIWIQKCHRIDKVNPLTSRICSLHFIDDDYLLKYRIMEYSSIRNKRLKEDAIPSQNLPVENKMHRENPQQKKKIKINLSDHLDNIINDNLKIESEGIPYKRPNNSEIIPEPEFVSCGVEYTDIGVQTSRTTEEIEIERLKSELELINQKLETETIKEAEQKKNLLHFFTKVQIKKLENPEKKIQNWSDEDIKNSLSLHAAGPEVYKILLNRNYPFPAYSTLRKWNRSTNENDDNCQLPCE